MIDERNASKTSATKLQLLKQVIDSGNADAQFKELPQKTLDTKQQAPDSLKSGTDAPAEQFGVAPRREIYDMRNAEQKVGSSDETYKLLPGALVRSEGQSPVDDMIANQAYDNCAKVVEFYRKVLDYSFLCGSKAIISSIHFEKGYQNASSLGDSIQQMVYGDGGGNLYNFTACLDIIGHEMTFGKDPQPASWSGIEAYKTQHKLWASFDNGSVHAVSGVLNRAFVLAAEAFGGYAWEKAGKIWWTTVSTHRIPPDCTFIQFADSTVAVAKELFGDAAGSIVRSSWDEVGVKEKPMMEGQNEGPTPAPLGLVLLKFS